MNKRQLFSFFVAVAVVVSAVAIPAMAQEIKPGHRVLYFTKSSGFEHSVVARVDNQLSYSEQVLTDLFTLHGIEIVCTKDGGLINAENLKGFDTVMFYTSGNLLEEGNDKQPPISEKGFAEFFEWLRAGGGFIGFHAATDSMRAEEPTEYTKMIGGAFSGHGKQEYATLDVVDPEFPAIVGLPIQFRMIDEWYLHNQVNVAKNMRVLITIDTQSMEQEMYREHAPYPITWCSNEDKGRVFVTALGHREDVWQMPMFQGMILKALAWTTGDVSGDASPNFEEVIK